MEIFLEKIKHKIINSQTVTPYIKNIVGGGISDYTKMMAEAREQALDRMVEEAENSVANAIVNIRFSTSYIMQRLNLFESVLRMVNVEPGCSGGILNFCGYILPATIIAAAEAGAGFVPLFLITAVKRISSLVCGFGGVSAISSTTMSGFPRLQVVAANIKKCNISQKVM